MSIVTQIRNALKKCGGPMTMDQLADANDWDAADRKRAYVQFHFMKKRGEIATSLDEGAVAYALVPDYVLPKAGRKAGPPIHVARADKTPKPIEAPVAPSKMASFCAGTQRTIKTKPTPMAPAVAERPNLALKINLIADDILQALRDAVADDNCKTLVAHLIDARQAMQNAARSYPPLDTAFIPRN